MAQRKSLSKLRTLVGEFVVIMAGVLAALAVDQWRAGIEDRELETGYLERLRADLEADTSGFAEFDRTFLTAKVAVLRALLEEDAMDRLMRRSNLVEDLTYSSFKALPPNRPATFEELESTGSLGLIRDVELRGAISEYYSGFVHISQILAESDGDYRQRLARALPGDAVFDWRLSTIRPTSGDLRSGLARLLEEPGLIGAVNAELEYTSGLAFYLRQYREEASVLLARLDGAKPGAI